MTQVISCFDIDGTLSRGLLFVPLVTSEYEEGYLSEEAFGSLKALLAQYKSGELAYEDAVERLIQVHAGGLAGKSYVELQEHAERFLKTHFATHFHTFGRPVVERLRATHELFVVTAEPQYLAEAVRDIFSMHQAISSEYEVKDGVFTGAVARSLAHRSAKDDMLTDYTIEYAFGDSEGDIEMLRRASRAMCISPTEGLRAVASEHGWQVFDGDDDAAILAALNA